MANSLKKSLKDKELSKNQWKIVIQNTRGLITNNSNKKVEYLKEITETDKILIMNITETWLNKEISNDEASVPDYKIFRGDRNEKNRQGGTAIYLLQTLEAEQISNISHNKCEMVAVKIPNLQTINIVVYRPPDTKSSDFNIILDNTEKNILRTENT